jgi:lipopolysaccharide transport system permease protein
VEIGPTVDWRSELSALWAYRELLYFLAWRDVKVRYKETLLGVAWAVLQPLATAVMFTLIFSRLAGLRSDGVPYPLWSYAGLVPWMYAANAVTQGAGSLVGNAALVTKVYFPRLIVPLASCLSGMLDLGVALVILAPLMAWYGIVPGPSLLVLPAVLVLAVVVAASVGLWLAALTARYRDVRYVVPFVMQLWLLATPVVYPSSALREPWRTLSGVNPMAGVVEGIRWALFAVPPPTLLPVLSVVATLAVLVSGLLYFRGVEGELADVV